MKNVQHSQYQNEFDNIIHRISIRTLLPEKGAIGFVHGIGEHIGRYTHVFDFFLNNGYSIYGFDSYGHGKSEGIRGDITSQNQWIKEIQMLLEWIQSETPSPTILYGHSLGGFKTLIYLLKNKKQPNFAIVTSPFIEQGNPEPKIKIAIGKIFSYIFPKILINNGLILKGISKNKKVIENYTSDPLNHSKISLRMARIMFNSAKELKKKQCINIPLLLEHGSEDLLTSHNATEKLSKNWKGDITFYSWRGGYHELHNEPEQKEILQKTLEWLEKKINNYHR